MADNVTPFFPGILVRLHNLLWGFQGSVTLRCITLDRSWGLPLPLWRHLRYAQESKKRQRGMESRGQRSASILTDSQVRDLPFPRFCLQTFSPLLPVKMHPEAHLPSDAGLWSMWPLQGSLYRRLQVSFCLLMSCATTLKQQQQQQQQHGKLKAWLSLHYRATSHCAKKCYRKYCLTTVLHGVSSPILDHLSKFFI